MVEEFPRIVYTPVTINGATVYLSTDGVSINGADVIDGARSWGLRDAILKRRDERGYQRFDVCLMTGLRVPVLLAMPSDAVQEVIGPHNDSFVDFLHYRVIRYKIGINIEAMKAADAFALYKLFLTHQQYWADRARALQKVTDEDLSNANFASAIGELESFLNGLPEDIELRTPIFSGGVTFAEGESFKAGAYAIDWVTDLSLSFVYEEIVNG